MNGSRWCGIYIYMYIHNGILLSYKKKEILPFATTWMDLEGIMLSEMSDGERQTLYDFTYIWNLKKNPQENRNRLIDTESKLVVAGGE